jgi:integrase
VGRKTTTGLIKRGGTWHVQKRIGGERIRESTGTSDFQEAERYLAFRMEQIRQASVYGVRPKRTFRAAATKYLKEATKSSLRQDSYHLNILMPFVGDLSLESVHMGTLHAFIQARKEKGVKNRTVNYALQVARHILNLAASEWVDENGLTWLPHAPKIKLLPITDAREPYPLSMEEQERLFSELPKHLKAMALFKVNTGCREAEVCSLKWDWEEKLPHLRTTVFRIPARLVKNRQKRLVILNRISQSVVDEMRGAHPEYVFTYRGRPIKKM